MVKVVAVLDRSGSMYPLVEDTIGGYNQFVSDLVLTGEELEITLVLFDDTYEVVYENTPVKDVPELNEQVYRPMGSTALLDALGRAITSLGEQERAVVLVITDGQENSSHEYNSTTVKKLIADRPNWEFQFFGADMDSIGDAKNWGMGVNAYAATGVGTRSAYTTMSNIVTSYAVDKTE